MKKSKGEDREEEEKESSRIETDLSDSFFIQKTSGQVFYDKGQR